MIISMKKKMRVALANRPPGLSRTSRANHFANNLRVHGRCDACGEEDLSAYGFHLCVPYRFDEFAATLY
jgi:hypothetical protein